MKNLAADGEVVIKFNVETDKAESDLKQFERIAKGTGESAKQAGEQAEKALNKKIKTEFDGDTDGVKKAAKDAKDAADGTPKKHKTEFDGDDSDLKRKANDVKDKTEKIPKKVTTQLIADAKRNGIDNFKRILEKLPKEQRTKLLAEYKRTGVVDYEALLRKIPAKLVTEIKLNDHASTGLTAIKHEAEAVKGSFSRFRSFVAGSAIGQIAASAFNGITQSIRGAIAAGMEWNKAQDTMRTVWHSLTTEAPKDGQELINTINNLSQHSIYSADAINHMAQSFYHVGSNVKDTKRWLNDFLAVGSTMHLTNEALSESAEMFAKIQAGGNATAEDINVMINRFPMFGEALEHVTGKSMKQIRKLTASGKLQASELGKAMDYVGKKYKSGTEEAMTSMMGMSMYIQNRWQTLWGKITKQSFNMNKQTRAAIRDLLSDDMMNKYAKGISAAVGSVTSVVVKIVQYINEHKKTIIDIFTQLYKIAAVIGKTVWTTFADTIKLIGQLFGAMTGQTTKSKSALETLDDMLKFINKHANEVATITRILLTLWTVNKIKSIAGAIGVWVEQLTGLAKSMRSVAASSELMGAASGGAELPLGGSTKTSGLFSRLGKSGTTASTTASKSGGFFSRMYGKLATKAGGGLSKFAKIGASGVGLATIASVFDEASQKTSLASKVGGVAGTAGGTWGGGTIGAMIGTAILPGIGTGIGTVLGSAVGGAAGQKVGESVFSFVSKAVKKYTAARPVKTRIRLQTDVDATKVASKNGKLLGKLNNQILFKIAVDKGSQKKAKKAVADTFKAMNKNVDEYYRKKYQKDKDDLKTLLKNGVITKKEYNERLAAAKKATSSEAKSQKSAYSDLKKAASNYTNAVTKLHTTSAKKNSNTYKQLEKDADKALDKYVDSYYKANQSIKKSVDSGAKQQISIYKKLHKERGALNDKDLTATEKYSQKQYNAAVKSARKTKNEIIDAANEQHKKTVDAIKRQYTGTSKQATAQRKKLIAEADTQQKKVVDKANDQYDKVTKKATDQKNKVHSEAEDQRRKLHAEAKYQSDQVTGAADDQKNGVKASAHKQAQGVINDATWQRNESIRKQNETGEFTADIWNKIIDGWNWIKSLWGGKKTKHVTFKPKAYAKGTKGLLKDEVALVGEEGFELAHTPGLGIYPIGVNSPEIRPLKAGTSILPHKQSKAFLNMINKLPAHKDGVTGFISGLYNGAKKLVKSSVDKAEVLGDLIAKGAGNVMKSITNAIGVDKLINKISGTNKQLISGMTSDIVKGFTSYLKKWFKKEGDAGGALGNPKGAGVTRWKPYIKRALAANGLPTTAAYVNAWLRQINTESGGNPKAVGGTDGLNEGRATGLLQTKPGTFAANAFSGHRNIFNGYDNMLAAIRYAKNRYGKTGMLGVIGHGHGYANGGEVFNRELAWIGEDGHEFVINPKKASADSLILKAAQARANYRPEIAQLISSANSNRPQILATQAATATHGGSHKAVNVDFSGVENKLEQLLNKPTTFVGQVDGAKLFEVTQQQQNRKRTINQLFKGVRPTTSFN